MEQSKGFQSVALIIQMFEQELVKCDGREKEQQQKYEEVEKEIEDHFAKCESVLAARKLFLLNECSTHLSTQKNEGKEVRQRLTESLDGCKELLRTGSLLYKANKETAEHVWEGAKRRAVTIALLDTLEVDLPRDLHSIQTHGSAISHLELVSLKRLGQAHVPAIHAPDPTLAPTPDTLTTTVTTTATITTTTPPAPSIAATPPPATSGTATPTPTLIIAATPPPAANLASTPAVGASISIRPPHARPHPRIPLGPHLRLNASRPPPATHFPLRNQQTEHDLLLKILVVGNRGVGKTSLLNAYIAGSFTSDSTSTTSVHFMMTNITVANRKWDLPGEWRFRKSISVFYPGAHGIMIAYDTSDKKSFEDVSATYLQRIDRYASSGSTKFILGCKCDHPKRDVPYEQAKIFSGISLHSLPPPALPSSPTLTPTPTPSPTPTAIATATPPSSPTPPTPTPTSTDCTLQ